MLVGMRDVWLIIIAIYLCAAFTSLKKQYSAVSTESD
jgi:hypothetical protein